MTNPVAIADQMPLSIAIGVLRLGSFTKARTTSGCRTTAVSPPTRAPKMMVGKAGNLSSERTNTRSRGINVQRPM